jgi:hypothetical protein
MWLACSFVRLTARSGPDQCRPFLLPVVDHPAFVPLTRHGAGNFTHFLNFTRMLSVLWIIVALWQGWYVTAGCLVLFWFLVTPLMVKLYPTAHYRAAAERGHVFGAENLAHIQHY